jgi:hypothetical protein
MLTAFETSVDLLARSEERKERAGKDNGEKIKALLNECGEFMTLEEKMNWGRQLMSIYIKDVEGMMMELHEAKVAVDCDENENENIRSRKWQIKMRDASYCLFP